MELLIIHPCDIEIALKSILGMSILVLTWYLIFRIKQNEDAEYKFRYKYQNKSIKKNKK